MSRPPVERYVRLTLTDSDMTFEPGLSWVDGEDIGVLSDRLRHVCEALLYRVTREVCPIDGWDIADFEVIASHFEESMREYWPDRAWFCEVHGGDTWVQIFQPYGVPKNQP